MEFSTIASPTMEPEGNSELPLVTLDETTEKLQVTLIRRRQALDLNYLVEFSDDLEGSTWETVTTTPSVTIIDDEWERVTVTDATGSPNRRFARVKVVLRSN